MGGWLLRRLRPRGFLFESGVHLVGVCCGVYSVMKKGGARGGYIHRAVDVSNQLITIPSVIIVSVERVRLRYACHSISKRRGTFECLWKMRSSRMQLVSLRGRDPLSAALYFVTVEEIAREGCCSRRSMPNATFSQKQKEKKVEFRLL